MSLALLIQFDWNRLRPEQLFGGQVLERTPAGLSIVFIIGIGILIGFLIISFFDNFSRPKFIFERDLPREVKAERLGRLIERQKGWSHRKNQRHVGSELRVLIKEAATDAQYVVGHSDQNHTVLVPKSQIGEMGLYTVTVDTATPHTLYGTVSGYAAHKVPLMMAS